MSDTDNYKTDYKTLEKYVVPTHPMEQEIIAIRNRMDNWMSTQSAMGYQRKEEINRLDRRISSVEINLCRMISTLERKMEDRTLILECIEERYDDYC